MIDAGSFANNAKRIKDVNDKYFRFGLNTPSEMAKALRQFADQIEQENFLVQKVQSGVIASSEDFTLRAIMIEYALRESKKD